MFSLRIQRILLKTPTGHCWQDRGILLYGLAVIVGKPGESCLGQKQSLLVRQGILLYGLAVSVGKTRETCLGHQRSLLVRQGKPA